MRVFVAGGAGFIGSHLVDHLLAVPGAAVTVFDNFSSGQRWHLEAHAGDPMDLFRESGIHWSAHGARLLAEKIWREAFAGGREPEAGGP